MTTIQIPDFNAHVNRAWLVLALGFGGMAWWLNSRHQSQKDKTKTQKEREELELKQGNEWLIWFAFAVAAFVFARWYFGDPGVEGGKVFISDNPDVVRAKPIVYPILEYSQPIGPDFYGLAQGSSEDFKKKPGEWTVHLNLPRSRFAGKWDNSYLFQQKPQTPKYQQRGLPAPPAIPRRASANF